jgi:hypothetical protein
MRRRVLRRRIMLRRRMLLNRGRDRNKVSWNRLIIWGLRDDYYREEQGLWSSGVLSFEKVAELPDKINNFDTVLGMHLCLRASLRLVKI